MQERKLAPEYCDWTPHDFDEERDLKGIKVWIREVQRCSPPFKPFVKWIWRSGSGRAMWQVGAKLSVPGSHCILVRFIEGYLCLTPAIITDENERKQREPIFRERIAPYIEDFGKEWGKGRDELAELFKRLEKVEVEKLSNVDLLDHFIDWTQVLRRAWYLHHLYMYVTTSIYMLFVDVCKELLGMDEQNPQFQKLISGAGFPNALFKTNAGLWQLGIQATELGLDQLFLTTEDADKLLSKLEESEPGRGWLRGFGEFLQEYGWRTERIMDASVPSWVEKPSLAIPDVKRAITTIAEKGKGFAIDNEEARLIREREEAEKNVLSQVPEAQREWFKKLMEAARWCSVWCEDHSDFTEFPSAATGRRVAIEWGRRFSKAGVIDDPEDVFFLIPEEIMMPSTIMEKCVMRPLVEKRKKRYEESLSWDLPIFIGDPSGLPEAAMLDPIVRMLAMLPIVKPELKADLYGAASTPGAVEGTARVLFSSDQLGELRSGEILVAPFTHAFWTPAFSVAAGVVTDTGGSLSHTVIVAREYGIPCVVGCLEATRKIQTGQRIRVDGDMGVVYIPG